MTIKMDTFDIMIQGNPPFGFRLIQKLMDNSLVVSKLRPQGKAMEAGLQEGDILLAVNSRPCDGFNCTQALNLIDSSSLPLILTIARKPGFEVPSQQNIPQRQPFKPMKPTSNQSSIIVSNSQSYAKPYHYNSQPPPFQTCTQPSIFQTTNKAPNFQTQHPLYQPPHHHPSPSHLPQASVTKHFRLGTTSHHPHEPTKVYVGSTRHSLTSNDEQVILRFGDQVSKKTEEEEEKNFLDPPVILTEGKYPTIEEQVQLARKVAQSVLAPINMNTKGHKMFLKAKERAAKYTTGADDEDLENAFIVPGRLQDMAKKIAYVPKLPHEATAERINAMSMEEIERLKLQEKKNLHTGVSPQMCFNLAKDLKNMKGKGGRMFAKRQAKAKSWTLGPEDDENESDSTKQKKVMDSINYKHSLENKEAPSPQLGYGRQVAKFSEQHQNAANRLESLIKSTKSAYSPWDAAEKFGNVDRAFDHLKPNSSMSFSSHWQANIQPIPPQFPFPSSNPPSMTRSYNPVQLRSEMAYSDL